MSPVFLQARAAFSWLLFDRKTIQRVFTVECLGCRGKWVWRGAEVRGLHTKRSPTASGVCRHRLRIFWQITLRNLCILACYWTDIPSCLYYSPITYYL